MFFLILIIAFFLLAAISNLSGRWIIGNFCSKKIGLGDVFPMIWKSLEDMFSFKEGGEGFVMLAMAFLTYALFKSQAFQSLLESKKKWLQKRRFATVVIVTIMASFLSAVIGWGNELIHFYPILIPLFLTMGFDIFSPFLCLYGGYVAGSLVLLNPGDRSFSLNYYVNKYVGSTKFTAMEALPFSILCWIIFTTIVVLFNVWYCNKISHKSSQNLQKFSEEKSEQVPPPFNWKQKFTLLLTFFFVLIGILGSISYFASENKKEWTAEEKENYKIITNEDINTEPEYTELGKVKIGKGEKNEMEIAEVKKKKESYWGKFGKWEARQLTYWYSIGAIFICLLNSLDVLKTLTKSVIKIVPFIISWVLISTTFNILGTMNINIEFDKLLKVDSPHARFYILPVIFVLFAILTVVLGFVGYLIGPLTKILASISRRTALYGFYSIYMSRFIATNVGHSNTIRDASLQAVKVPKKEYYKKTWLLWLILFVVALTIIIITPWLTERIK